MRLNLACGFVLKNSILAHCLLGPGVAKAEIPHSPGFRGNVLSPAWFS